MAKNKTKAQVEDDFDDIDTDEGQSGGISDAQLKKAAKEFSSLKSKMDDARSPMGAFFKDFEEKGGHKAALKIAMRFPTWKT